MHYGQSRGKPKNEKNENWGKFINFAKKGGEYSIGITGLGGGSPRKSLETYSLSSSSEEQWFKLSLRKLWVRNVSDFLFLASA